MDYEQIRAKLGSKISGVISPEISEVVEQDAERSLKIGFEEEACKVTFSLGNYPVASIDTGLNLPWDKFKRGQKGDLKFGRYKDRVKTIEFTGGLRAQFIFEYNFELKAGCDIQLKNIKRYLYHILKQQGETAEEKNNTYITRWIVAQVVDLKSDTPIEELQEIPDTCVDVCASVIMSMIQRLKKAVVRLKGNLSPDHEISRKGEEEIVDSVEASLRESVKSGELFDDRASHYFVLLNNAAAQPGAFKENYLTLDNNKREDYCQLILTGEKMFVELSEDERFELYDKWLSQKREIGSSQYRSHIKGLSAWAAFSDGSPLNSLCTIASSDDLPGIVSAVLQNEAFQKKDKDFRRQLNTPLRRYLEWVYSYIRNSGSTNAADLFKEICLLYPEFSSQPYKLDFKDKKMKKEDMKTSKEKSVDNEISAPELQNSLFSRNRILFGAPGTGKSYKLKQDIKSFALSEDQVERVTFHPEYSYFDFVGSYKPVMEGEGNEERIKYRFVPGPFTRVLQAALASQKQAVEDKRQPRYLLVIEEINRARVAAVFGDMFQLLDRDDAGKSEYAISPAKELEDYLVSEGALSRGAKIYIPGNMYIWATMNSADQGVYPMDTAFKRRWSFEYMGIDDGVGNVEGKFAADWNALRTRVNELLQDAGINEDKQMGPFFLKKSELDDREAFVSAVKNKVLMYLFEDAARHKRTAIFKLNGKEMRYSVICEKFADCYGDKSAAKSANSENASEKMNSVLRTLFSSGSSTTPENGESSNAEQ